MPVFRNLFTNPSFEAGSAPVEVARNRFTNPIISGTSVEGWAVVAGTGGVAAVGNIVGITPPPGITATREVRATWTVGAAGGFPSLNAPRVAVTPGESVPYRLFARRGTAGVLRLRFTYLQADGVTNAAPSEIIRVSPALPAAGSPAAWWEVSGVTAPMPVNAAFVRFEITPASGEMPGSTHWIGVTSASTAASGLLFDGSGSPDPDLTASWTGPVGNSASVLSATPAAGVGTGWRSSQWSAVGAYSLRVPTGSTHSITLTAQTLLVTPRYNDQIVTVGGVPQAAGELVRFTGTTTVLLGEGWWDRIAILAGDYSGDWFDGNSTGASWDGTPNASTSTWVRTIPTLAFDDSGNPYVEVYFDAESFDVEVAYIQVWRYSENREWKVRGGINIAPGVAALDFEAPPGETVSYRAEMFTALGGSLGWTETETITVPDFGVTVHNPMDPTVYVKKPVDAVTEDLLGTNQRPTVNQVVYTEGKTVGTHIGSRRRGIVGVVFGVSLDTLTEADTIDLMLGDYTSRQVSVLVVRTPKPVRLPRTLFLSVSDPNEVDLNVRWGGELTQVVFKGTEVDPPFPGLAVPLLTYDDLDAAYPSYDDRDAAYASYSDMDRDYSLAGLAG